MSVATKKAVYKDVVMAMLLYGLKTWVVNKHHIKRLSVIHNNCCVKIILEVSRYQQRQE